MNESFVKDVLNQIVHNIDAVIAAIDGRTPGTAPAVGVENNAKAKPVCTLVNGRQRVYEDCGDGWGIVYRKNDAVAGANEGGDKMPLQYTDGSFRKYRDKLQYRYYEDGKQKSIYGYSENECWLKRNQLNHQTLSDAKKIEQPIEIVTYSEWLTEWMKLFKETGQYKTGYLKAIKSYIKNYINPALGSLPICKIKPIMIQRFLANIESDGTRTKVAAILSESFRDATVMEYVSRSPYEGVRFKRYEQPELGAMTHRQQIDFLQAIDRCKRADWKMPTFARTLLMTGMRQGELNALRVCDVDFKNHEIHVQHTFDRYEKENVKTKTKAGKRVIPIATTLENLLKPVVESCNGTEQRLFGYEGSYTPSYFSKIFKELGIDFTGHNTRHCFITNAYELGFPPYMLKRWVGHSEVKQADVYLALRKPSEYVETEITAYMKELKKITVLVPN